MEYRNPTPTADIIIELIDHGGKIVLIERANEPRGLALPGGFVDEGELMEAAAVREAREETNLEVVLTDLLYIYSDPARDPRLHTVTAVYIGRASGTPRGGDDAKRTLIISPDELPGKMVFDHAQILQDYVRFKKTGERPKPGEIIGRVRRT